MKKLTLILFTICLTLNVQAQDYLYATEKQVDNWLEKMKIEKCEIDTTSIAGYTQYLKLEAKTYIDSMNRHHGVQYSIYQAFDWLVESNPRLTYEERGDSLLPNLIVTRPGREPWTYSLFRYSPEMIALNYQSYGFLCEDRIGGLDFK